MRYQIKKFIFFLYALLSIPALLLWFNFYFYAIFGVGPDLIYQEGIIVPIFLSLLLLDVGSIIYLVFYRRECRVWPKLLMLFTGTIPTYTSMLIYNDSPIYTIGDPLPTGWTNLALILILLLFAAIALAAIVWLIIAMVKYKASVETGLSRSYRLAKPPAGRGGQHALPRLFHVIAP